MFDLYRQFVTDELKELETRDVDQLIEIIAENIQAIRETSKHDLPEFGLEELRAAIESEIAGVAPPVQLFLGNSESVLKGLPENSVDSIVTDPPYGLSFMGKKWDYDVPSVELWKEVFRVLKPGGHLLAFGGTRTYHRLVVNIEDAGFEIRDQIQWLYGQGFPKSLDVSKAIDKAAGAEREVVGERDRYLDGRARENLGAKGNMLGNNSNGVATITTPSTDSAKQWEGWGTALKPANEPICLARKPLEKGLTVAQNVQKWGTGALNIDESRIPGAKPDTTRGVGGGNRKLLNTGAQGRIVDDGAGRFPANVILDEVAGEMLDAQTQHLHGAGTARQKVVTSQANADSYSGKYSGTRQSDRFGDSGGASRFFYCAKASTSERNSGVEKNIHPTVKPVKLMEYLCRLITPPGGIVLDPFMGSGTTGVAAKNLDFKFTGVELNFEYYQIALNRIQNSKKEAKND